MSTNRNRIFIILMLLGAGVCAAVFNHGKVNAASDDSTEIKRVVEGFTNDFNRHDAQSISMWFSTDADFINVRQESTHGREAIAGHFASLFVGVLKNAHRTYKVTNMRFLSPDVATVDMTYELTGAAGANASMPPRKGLYDWIVTRQSGKWLITVLHESEISPPAS